MSVPDHKRLVELLLKKSERGELDWKSSASEESFHVSFKDNSVRISKGRSARTHGSTLYIVELINDEGTVVDLFHDEELDGDDRDVPYYQILRDIFELARRRALGADKILKEIISELDDDVPF